MKFSTRTRYGLRMLIHLGLHYNKGVMQLKEIARSECISTKYLEQIVRILKPSGLISVVRGAKGGYALKVDPEEVRLDNVFEVLEGSLDPIDCFSSAEPCQKKDSCPSREVWHGLANVIKNYLNGITLKELVDRYEEFNNSSSNMFYI